MQPKTELIEDLTRALEKYWDAKYGNACGRWIFSSMFAVNNSDILEEAAEAVYREWN